MASKHSHTLIIGKLWIALSTVSKWAILVQVVVRIWSKQDVAAAIEKSADTDYLCDKERQINQCDSKLQVLIICKQFADQNLKDSSLSYNLRQSEAQNRPINISKR